MRKKVILAAGGTGGHLFPAQALAQQLESVGVEVVIVGAGLATSPYLDREAHPYREVVSGTPFRQGVMSKLQGTWNLGRGVWESMGVLREEKPDLVVGFGSFHSFPVLGAAVLRRVPLVLFESNAVPGKVVRLFSGRAQVKAVYLAAEGERVEIPRFKNRAVVDKVVAREYFGLNQEGLTLLAFGGSQGARGINRHVLELVPWLKALGLKFQLLHFTGDESVVEEVKALCDTCCVKKFEKEMDLAWQAADVALTRAGALTVSEVLRYSVPTIFVPYPYATEQHQLKNAELLARSLGGVRVFEEKDLCVEAVGGVIEEWVSEGVRENLRQEMRAFGASVKRRELVDVVLEQLGVNR